MKKKFALMVMAFALALSPAASKNINAEEPTQEVDFENIDSLKAGYESLLNDYRELEEKYKEALSKIVELEAALANLPTYEISGTVNNVTETTFTMTTSKGNVYTFSLGDAMLNIGETISFSYKGTISSGDEVQPGTVSNLTVTAEAPAGAEYETGITYDDLSRNPDSNEGKLVKFSGTVVQLVEDTSSDEIQIRFAVDDDYDKMLYCGYDKSIVESRVLEDDRITIYGMSVGLISYESTLGGTITIPAVYVDRIDQ